MGLIDTHTLKSFKFPYLGKLAISLEKSLSITTLRCDLAIATRARKMHK